MSIDLKRQGIALLVLTSFGAIAQAGSVSAPKPEAATQTLAQIERVARTASDHAQQYGALSAQPALPVSAKDHLVQLQSAVNAMGKEVSSLQANRSSLSQWQQAALDQIRPLLVSAAARTSSEIVVFNDNAHLWTPANRSRVQQIAQDTTQIATTLNDYIMYQTLREREARIAVAHPEVNSGAQPEVTPVAQPEVNVGR